MARIVSFVAPVGVAFMGVLIAATIGVWQLSGQKTPSDILGTISYLAIGGVVFIVVAIPFRALVDGREEYERERKKNSINAIGDFIGEGDKLKSRIRELTYTQRAELQQIRDEIGDWEHRIEDFITKYRKPLVPVVFDTSEEIGQVVIKSYDASDMISRVNARLKKLSELLHIIAVG